MPAIMQEKHSPNGRFLEEIEAEIQEKSKYIARLLEEQHQLYQKALHTASMAKDGINIALQGVPPELKDPKSKTIIDLDAAHGRRELLVGEAEDYAALHLVEGSVGMLDENIDRDSQKSSLNNSNTDTTLHKMLHAATKEKELEDSRTPLVKFILSDKFELIFAVLIIANVVLMCVEAEVKGRSVLPGQGDVPKLLLNMFDIIQVFFSSLFTLELFLRIFALRRLFLKSGWDIFDMVLVVMSWLVIGEWAFNLFNPLLLRLARLVRIIRLLRVARISNHFEAVDTLHLMMESMHASMPVIIWVIVVIVPVIGGSALVLNLSLTDFIKNESTVESDRTDCYQYFGTFLNAFYTMYEVTFGNYGPISAFVTHRVNGWWGVFFLSYKLIVSTAMLRVIYAIFLHITLACATASDEILVVKKKRDMHKFVAKMDSLFLELDASQDGYLSREEFMMLTKNPRIQEWVAVQDLEVRDAEIIFDMIAEDAERVAVKELIYGFSRLRGNARSIDSMVIIELCTKTLARMEKMYNKFDDLKNAGNRKPGKARTNYPRDS